MGWVSDLDGHEGNVIGLVMDEVLGWRELGYFHRYDQVHAYAVRILEMERALDERTTDRTARTRLRKEINRLTSTFWGEKNMADHPSEAKVDRVQVACSCGWRSPMMTAPLGTTFAPWTVDLPEHGFGPDYYERAIGLWTAHIAEAAKVDDVTKILLGIEKPRVPAGVPRG